MKYGLATVDNDYREYSGLKHQQLDDCTTDDAVDNDYREYSGLKHVDPCVKVPDVWSTTTTANTAD